MKQYVITVGCEYGCGGSAVGRALARNLGIAYYDRTLIDKIIEETGVSHDLMEMADAGKDVKGKRENAAVSTQRGLVQTSNWKVRKQPHG